MKTILLLFLLIAPIFATKQVGEILHFDGEKYYIDYFFPLDSLHLDSPPFSGADRRVICTGCYRGYQGVWRIKNDSLFLVQVTEYVRESPRCQNPIVLFRKNNLEPISSDGSVFADWVSEDIYLINDSTFIAEDRFKRNYSHIDVKIQIEIKNGIISTPIHNKGNR